MAIIVGNTSVTVEKVSKNKVVKGMGFHHVALKVDDVDAAYKRALEYGAREKSAPKVVPLDSAPVKLTLNCGFVYGPSGEEIEFFKVVSAE